MHTLKEIVFVDYFCRPMTKLHTPSLQSKPIAY